MIRLMVLGAALWASSAGAQQRADVAMGGLLRVLDKTSGEIHDVRLRNGQSADMGLLQLRLDECRVPSSNPSGDAFAKLDITYGPQRAPVFAGWMVASSPALNPMDHPRFDVWVLRCTTS